MNSVLTPTRDSQSRTVVAVNSGSGYAAKGDRGDYSASKFALRAWADALRQEELAAGVRVSSVHPGRVDTEMQHELRAAEQGAYEAEQYLRPATVAAAIGFVLRAPEDAVVTSLDLRPRAIG